MLVCLAIQPYYIIYTAWHNYNDVSSYKIHFNYQFSRKYQYNIDLFGILFRELDLGCIHLPCVTLSQLTMT